MRRLQNSTIEDEDIDKIDDDDSEEDKGDNPSASHIKATTKKDKDEKMKQMLSEATRTHELLAKTFYESKLKMEATLCFRIRQIQNLK